jgi:16S rRNA (cytidine1402-2'-O)-methyltransferase
MGTLYIVATPIGNLEDITLRAINTLKEVDYIACEDTRHTMKLTNHFDIHSKLLSYYSYNEKRAAGKILDLLAKGNDIALVCDSGTPAISDPGAYIVRLARKNNHNVIPIPGASALSLILSVAGFPVKNACFLGFLSPKPGKRRKKLKEMYEKKLNIVIYESPNRILKLLTDLNDIAPDANVFLGREMTKIHEEYLCDIPLNLLTQLSEKKKIKGEICLFIAFNLKKILS